MNLDELRTFLEVVDTGSLVTAARRLNVTPSTVTARINGLEDEVGQKLLHRHKSGAELTSPGFKFKRYAEVMVQLWAQARSEVSLPGGFEGVCNVGLEFDLWQGLGQRFLDHVRQHCPGIALALWPGEQRMIDRWLAIGLVDIAFCYAPQAGEKFASRVLYDDDLVMVSRDADAAAVLDANYVYVDHGDEFRRQHAAAFPGDVTSALTIASADWALDHLLRNGGSGYLPRRHVEGRSLHIVKDAPVFTRRVYVVETAQTTRQWHWYESAIAALRPTRTTVDIRTEDAGSAIAQWCLSQYFAELDRLFEDGFDAATGNTTAPESMNPPSGLFVVAWQEGKPVGCGALLRLDAVAGEVKRMWVASGARGQGIAGLLLRQLESEARRWGLRIMRLDTNRALTDAQAMYRKAGYREIARYNDNPYAHHWFEKTL